MILPLQVRFLHRLNKAKGAFSSRSENGQKCPRRTLNGCGWNKGSFVFSHKNLKKLLPFPTTLFLVMDQVPFPHIFISSSYFFFFATKKERERERVKGSLFQPLKITKKLSIFYPRKPCHAQNLLGVSFEAHFPFLKPQQDLHEASYGLIKVVLFCSKIFSNLEFDLLLEIFDLPLLVCIQNFLERTGSCHG